MRVIRSILIKQLFFQIFLFFSKQEIFPDFLEI